MEVVIVEVLKFGSEFRVVFDSGSGRANALWTGPSPIVGDRRFIELAVESSIVVGENLLATSEAMGLKLDERGTSLVGKITAVERDGYVRMDFGSGSIGLEVDGEAPKLHGRYRLTTSELKAFDSNL